MPQTVLVIDSGVGGLSIVSAIQRGLPDVAVDFVSDNLRYPYGTRSEAEVIEAVVLSLESLPTSIKPAITVIACNTASTVVLPTLRQKYSHPIVGVVPAIRPAAGLTRSGKIGLLATPGTCARPYTDQLIAEFAKGCQVHKVGSRALVDLAEFLLRGGTVTAEDVQAEVAGLFSGAMAIDPKMDVVVLGCTHFPFLAQVLAAAAPWPVHWIDSGEAIARRVASLLKGLPPLREEGEGNTPPVSPNHSAFFTRWDKEAEKLVPYLRQIGFSSVQGL